MDSLEEEHDTEGKKCREEGLGEEEEVELGCIDIDWLALATWWLVFCINIRLELGLKLYNLYESRLGKRTDRVDREIILCGMVAQGAHGYVC